ncbi:MAG: alpha/beta hydrolase [Candidatus Fervidibacter sp.]|uniref:alpha/beta hydrolase n=1 Tax=Candidatus Fervidibacter sp. TaxID=3100871 RepID=UPI0040498E29
MNRRSLLSLKVTAQVWLEATVAGLWVTLFNKFGQLAQRKLSQKVKVYWDIIYAEHDNVSLKLDLFVPIGPAPQNGYPAVIALHGGAWCTGSKRDMRWTSYLIAQQGMVVACVGYRLAPKFRYPAQLIDCQAALRWLSENAEEWNVNPEHITAFGISSGGHLALLLGLKELPEGAYRVKKVVAIFPPTDLTATYYQEAARNPPPLTPNYLLNFLGATYDENPELWRDASPIYHVHPNAAPCFIIQGKKDLLVPVDQAIRFAEAMRKEGAKVTLVLIEGLGHGYSLRPKIMNQLNNALEEAIRFLKTP